MTDVACMTEEEQRILGALAWMCEQYVSGPASVGEFGELDHHRMRPGERAVAVLADFGLVEVTSSRGGAVDNGRQGFAQPDLMSAYDPLRTSVSILV